MAINWFPGHMHKARKEMARVLPEIDVVLEVLDARIPFSSENPMLGEMAEHKPRMRVLTKADLADEQITQAWLRYLQQDTQHDALAISIRQPATIRQIPARLKTLVCDSGKQRIKPRVAMIVGIPNVGKSTLINELAGRAIAKTGNEPAITKRQQLIRLSDNWSLRDTPGLLWPKVDNIASGYRLAATGAVRDTAMNSADVAVTLLDYLLTAYPELLIARYGQHLPLQDSVETLEAIGKARGCLGAGALVDFERSGRLLLTEFRDGMLGRVTLETPEMREQELTETSNRLAQLAEKRAKRKADKATRRSTSRHK